MALAAVVAGNRIVISDLNAFYNLLKGVTGSGETITLVNNAESLIFQPSSDPAAGTRVWTVKNNAGTVLASMRFDGLLKLLSAAAAPASAVVGSVYFDSVLDALRVYDGTNWRDLAGGSTGPNPNLVLNSDFSRRTVFGLAMPEVFADTSGYAVLGGTPTVGSNILTFNAADNWIAWPKVGYNANFWRDGRASLTFKATDTTDNYEFRFHHVDSDNYIEIANFAGSLRLRKRVAAVNTDVVTVAQAMTVNRWYWFEIECQGTTVIAKMYDTGGTASGVTKASSTLLQTMTGTVADAAVAAGGISFTASEATTQVGGIATGNGGVYVETWLPESWQNTGTIFTGTLGGQAIGFDEAADAGPIGKQWAIRTYIPATSRKIVVSQLVQDGAIAPSTTYESSIYLKVAGLGGSGTLARSFVQFANSAGTGSGLMSVLVDGGDTVWTRKTGTPTASAAGDRRAIVKFEANADGTATGTAYFMLPQLEQGSAATAWRNAPADDAPMSVELVAPTVNITTTSASSVEVDPRDHAINFFMPWDGVIELTWYAAWINSGANTNRASYTLDGVEGTLILNETMVAATARMAFFRKRLAVAAGKHRLAIVWRTTAGTATVNSGSTSSLMGITATRGK